MANWLPCTTVVSCLYQSSPPYPEAIFILAKVTQLVWWVVIWPNNQFFTRGLRRDRYHPLSNEASTKGFNFKKKNHIETYGKWTKNHGRPERLFASNSAPAPLAMVTKAQVTLANRVSFFCKVQEIHCWDLHAWNGPHYKLPGFKFWLHYFLIVWPCSRHLTCLQLSFLKCNMKTLLYLKPIVVMKTKLYSSACSLYANTQ